MERKSKVISLMVILILYVILFQVLYTSFWKSSSSFWNKKLTFLEEKTTWLRLWNDPSSLSSNQNDYTDVHTEEGSETEETRRLAKNSIAIGCGITSKGVSKDASANLAESFHLFKTFIPSFCETASVGFDYHFYLAYDFTDNLFKTSGFLTEFRRIFMEMVSKLCPLVSVSLHLVQCSHSGRPAWAQNDAMLQAYLDNAEYFYRINDDTVMKTKNWTEIFIRVLLGYDPPNVGVVGPKHSGGNTAILTYDFVHRTHVDVFGVYYPRIFTDWYADGWITRTYLPDRCTKVQDVHVIHTLGLGRRYNLVGGRDKLQPPRVKADKIILQRYIKYVRSRDSVIVDGRKVIAMSLFGKNPRYSWGAIRNTQLVPIIFPGWKLRIYVASRNSTDDLLKSLFVPQRILNKLKQLGAELTYVKTKSIPPIYWRYLVIDDNNVDHFLIRNAHSRLSERDAAVVKDWLQNQNQSALHCIRDHPKHTNQSIVDGLWGGNRSTVRQILGQDIETLLSTIFNDRNNSASVDLVYRLALSHRKSQSFSVIDDVLWPLLSSSVRCHDSVSCDHWPNSYKFPVSRVNDEFLGQEFDLHHEPESAYIRLIKTVADRCNDS